MTRQDMLDLLTGVLNDPIKRTNAVKIFILNAASQLTDERLREILIIIGEISE